MKHSPMEMMTMTNMGFEKKVGKIIRVEWNKETGEVRLVMEILDPAFKSRVLHSKDLQDILTIKGKDVIAVATRSEDE